MDIEIILTDIDKLIQRKRDFYPNAKPGLKTVLNIDVKVLEATREFILQQRQEANDMIKELREEEKRLHATADILYEICIKHGITEQDIIDSLHRGLDYIKEENKDQVEMKRITIPHKLRPKINEEERLKAEKDDDFIRDEFGNVLINKSLENMRKKREQNETEATG